MSLFVSAHKFIFEDEFTCGLVTKDQPTCDSKSNPSALMSKIDMILKKQPHAIYNHKADTDRAHLRIVNKQNGSGFFGYSCTGDVSRGGRTSAFLIDELDFWDLNTQFAAWNSLSYVTNSRFVISTPCSREGLYYKLVSEHDKRGITLVDVGWESDPRRNRGLYRSTKGKLELLDVEYWNHFKPESYVDEETGESKFILDGKLRSPWYDKACIEAGTPQQIARELDRDFSEAQSNFFPASVVEKIEKECRQPNHTGHVITEGDESPGSFVATKSGPFSIWTPLSSLDWTPEEWSRYVIGVDLCQGLNGDQTSNSVIEIIDRRTEEQIGEFTARDILPADMADMAVAVARWLNDAHLIWDADGPGRAFTKRVEELGYPHVYWHRSLEANYGAKPSNKMGFYIKDNTKDQLLGRLRQGVMRKKLKINSLKAAEEFPQFIFKDGKIAHSKALVTTDDGSKGVSHGDCVIALALAWWYHVDLPAIDPAEPPARKIHRHTMAWREEQHRNSRRREEDWV
ncbi:hypothetical protein [Bremerella sp. P1]|uniref:hypothetical protein n=1 Tax=Bremerella sp. P1 TaxID=3026424 RepID=UPI00236863C5|nr:hypothetical protein [Bremerella sp. P1]WDI44783.1 hypothetical protein PSR63_12635 [Bremerella sp. P1]